MIGKAIVKIKSIRYEIKVNRQIYCNIERLLPLDNEEEDEIVILEIEKRDRASTAISVGR